MITGLIFINCSWKKKLNVMEKETKRKKKEKKKNRFRQGLKNMQVLSQLLCVKIHNFTKYLNIFANEIRYAKIIKFGLRN